MTFIQKVKIENINIQPVLRRRTARLASYPVFGDRYNSVLREHPEFNIEAKVMSNPVILKILNEYELPLHVNRNTLKSLKDVHLQNSRIAAVKIYSALPERAKFGVSVFELQQAALLHDYGKILIPENILNKKEALTQNERKIIELHPILGYELLKDEGLNNNVLTLIKYHHQIPNGEGYPKIDNDYKHSLAFDILHAADEYAALVESRPYKPALSKNEALNIMAKDMKDGKISPMVFDALIRIV